MNNSRKLVVAHYISSFLPLTENWIYRVLRNHKVFIPIVITRSVKNLQLYPFDKIYSLGSKSRIAFYWEIIQFKIKRYIPYFANVCKKENTSILHIHFGNQGVKSLGLKKHLNLPLVCSFYGFDAFKLPKDNHYKKAYTKLFRYSDKLLVLGPYMKSELVKLGCPENKIAIQHLGIDTKKIDFKKRELNSSKPFKLLLACSFVEKKGVEIVINALEMIKHDFNFSVEIIGDGFLRSNIESLIRTNNLDNQVVLHGYKPYDFFIEKAYECDIFVQASKTTLDNDKEGTPMSLVDAMATGMPVVSTRHSDIPEIVIDGYNGFLAEENNVADFAEALKRILTYNNFEELSINARKHVEEQFDIYVQNKKLEDIYINLIETHEQ